MHQRSTGTARGGARPARGLPSPSDLNIESAAGAFVLKRRTWQGSPHENACPKNLPQEQEFRENSDEEFPGHRF
jgi:hypothetical protein